MGDLRFENLNNDILLLIFDHCSNNDLLSLSRANKRFADIIESHIFFKRSLDCLITGHRGHSLFSER